MMFQLHDRTRRRIALAIFFTLGVMPTLAVSAWGLWWRSARYVAGEAEQLGWRLGMAVSLSAIRHPLPGVVVYEGLQVREPETNQPVFRCREVEARCDAPSGGSTGPGLRLTLSQPEINASQWGEIWRLVDRVLTRRAEAGDIALSLFADELGLSGREFSQKLVHVEARVEARPGGPQVQVSFRLAGTTGDEPARIRVTRNRQRTPPATGLELDTGGTPLPCRLLAIGLSGFELPGPTSLFCGSLRAIVSGDGPSGELVGQFTEVDLQRLVSDHLPHRMSGTADIDVEVARFARGRLEETAGSLVAGPGLIGRSLLEAAAEQLGMTAGVVVDGPDRLVSYEQLAVWFACDAKGLRVRGLSPTGASGTILAGRLGTILSEPQPPHQLLPLAAVVQALAPEAERLVPIARRNDWLLRRLPSASPTREPEVENPLR